MSMYSVSHTGGVYYPYDKSMLSYTGLYHILQAGTTFEIILHIDTSTIFLSKSIDIFAFEVILNSEKYNYV